MSSILPIKSLLNSNEFNKITPCLINLVRVTLKELYMN